MDSAAWYYSLYRLGRDLGRHRELAESQAAILQHVVDAFHANSGSLALFDEHSRQLTIVAGIELPQEVIGQSVELGTGVMGWVAEQREELLLNGDASSDQRFHLSPRPNQTARANSAMCWPLIIEQRLIGVVSINRREGVAPFTEKDLEQGRSLVNMLTYVLENAQLQRESAQRIEQLEILNSQLDETQHQLLQSEKMASIGQLAAGIAHEINNPIGYVNSNLTTLRGYLRDLLELLQRYEGVEEHLEGETQLLSDIQAFKSQIDLEYLRDDSLALMDECDEGITRVKKIVQDLKDFSRVDSGDWEWADVHNGIDSTLNVVWNEIKYKAEVKKIYGDLPAVRCMPSQLNQVFMNLLVNAAQAMGERGTITISTASDNDQVAVEIKDTGCGIPADKLQRVFDPFYTTKPVGKGTGLGLSLSYGIVQKHGGTIEAESEVGVGTTFRVLLPVAGPPEATEESAA